MSRYPIALKPQGIVPRDLSLTLQLQPVVKPGTPTALPPCALGIATLSPVVTDTESFFTVFASEIQASDLEVVMTLADAGSPPAIAFLGTGSPPAFDSASVTAIIPAGSDYVIVPFLAGSDAIGSPPLTITATSPTSDCGDASTELEIVPCVAEIADVTYLVLTETLTPFLSPSCVARGAGAEYFGSVGSLAVDTNAVTIGIPTVITIVCQVIGKLCPGDVPAFGIARTGGTLWTDNKPVSDDFRGNGAIIRAWGAPIGLNQSTISPAFAHGDTVVITATLNGVLIDHPRATFTITIT